MKLFNPNDIFSNRYQIVRPLGSGGMSEVYLAKDLNLNEDLVAIKFLHLELQQYPTQIKRFQQEVLLTRRVNSPYVVKTFDAEISSDHIYFVMEYLEGINLNELIDSENLQLDQVILIICSIILGLEAVHQVGIIHRDLKAENILVTNDGQLKIMDFGVAKVQKNDLTIAGEIVGSSCYMSPEVWKGDPVTNKSDIYSLGVLAYQMLTNHFPFDGENMMQIMYQHLEGEIKEPKQYNSLVPAELNELILRMLEIDPKLRPELAEIKTKLLDIDADLKESGMENLESQKANQLYLEPAVEEVTKLKLTNLKSNSYNAKNLANIKTQNRSATLSQNWQTMTKLRSLKKVNFSTFKFLIAVIFSLATIFTLIIISDPSSDYSLWLVGQGGTFDSKAFEHSYIFQLLFFSVLFSLPIFTILFSTVKFSELFVKFLYSVACFLILLIVINYTYVSWYSNEAVQQLPLDSPAFMWYLEVTLPRAIQHLIDAVLLIPIASQAFVSSTNSWNNLMVDIFNGPPLIWMFHYNSLIIFVFLLLIINKSNLNFFQIAPRKRYRLPLILFALFIIEPNLKEYLVVKSLWTEELVFFKITKFEFVIDNFYLLCSLVNWTVLLGYLFFATRLRPTKQSSSHPAS